MLVQFLQDALFAAIAAIGFAAISNPPKRAYIYCAIIAAVGHSARFLMMHQSLWGMNIVMASTLAAFIIGFLAVLLSPVSKTPAETCLFPSLLPMIPGMYAYRADVLKELTALPQSSLEIAESLEQLRWLQNGYKIKCGISTCPTIGIDTPEDLEQARQYVLTLND